MASRPASAGKMETEAADDFVLNATTAISIVTFTGLITGASPTIGQVRVEFYRVFPLDSTNPPDGRVPTRVNSPSDVEFVDRDSASANLTFTTTTLVPNFTASNSVLNGINAIPNQTTGGDGPVSGREVQITVTFSTPVVLQANHYFFVPQVQVTGGEFYWLSSPRPNTITPFTPDLQAWIRRSSLDPDWLRVGTDIVGGTTPPTFNGSFTLTGTSTIGHDFNGDTHSDILWRANTGDIAMWFMNGTTLQSSAGVGAIDPAWQIVKTPTGTGDFNGDNRADILWHHTNGNVAVWLMNGATISSSAALGAVDASWQIAGVGDFNGDGKADILWRNSSGALSIWFMNGTTIASSAGVASLAPTWQVAAIADLNGDGKADIVLRNSSSGDVAVWLMNGATIASSAGLGVLPPAWQIVGTGDFDGDGNADILWRHSTGALAMWFMNGTTIASSAGLGAIDPAWTVASTGDYDGNGKSDILWRNTGGTVAMWLMNGASIASSAGLGALPAAWSIVE